MARLNTDRQEKLEPIRIQKAKEEITKLGYEVQVIDKRVEFIFQDSKIVYYPYSGWASVRTIKDGRGLNKLINQIKNK